MATQLHLPDLDDEELIKMLGFDTEEDTHLPNDIAAEFTKIHEETIKENENPIPD